MPGAYGVDSLLEMAVAYMLLRLFCVGKRGVVQEEEMSDVKEINLYLTGSISLLEKTVAVMEADAAVIDQR